MYLAKNSELDEESGDWVIIKHTELVRLNMDWFEIGLVDALEDEGN